MIAAIVDWGLGQGWPASRRWVCEPLMEARKWYMHMYGESVPMRM
mgnify:CR=1 FL=1